jgi:hypothetical protein
MTSPVWPKHLRSCVTSSKQRNRVAGFETSEVQAGPAFTRLVTEDTPTIYDVSFTFNRDEARAFRSWQVINNFANVGGWFYLPIQIEEGLTTQYVMLLPPGFQCTGQNNNVFNYSASVVARKEESEDDKFPNAILAMFENNPCSSIEDSGKLFDIAINISLPCIPNTPTGNYRIPLVNDLSIYEEFI